MENFVIKKDASNNIPLKIVADFEVFINLDSAKTIYIKNKSKNYNKLIWDFGDNTTSHEINPKHTYTINGKKKVKLVVENEFKQKDSLVLSLYDKMFEYQNECEYFLTDISKVRFTVYRIKIYAGDGIFSYTIGDKFNINPTEYIDSFSFDTYSTKKNYFFTYYTENKVTTFKKHNTIDLRDFYSLTRDLGSSALLYDRTFSSGTFDPIKFNDTILKINYNNGFIEVVDSTLGHSFKGYLSSHSASNTFVFSMPNRLATIGGIESESISFSKTNNYVSLKHEWYSGIYSTNIEYFGLIQ